MLYIVMYVVYCIGMSLDDKRKLLQFTTGSDRIPVGGLSR